MREALRRGGRPGSTAGIVAFALTFATAGLADPPATVPQPTDPQEVSFLQALQGSRGARGADERKAQFDRIAAAGGPSPALAEAVRLRYADLVHDLETRLAPRAIHGILRQFNADLERRREEAITFIRDEKRFFKEGPGHEESIRQGVALVDAVREVWDPGPRVLERVQGLQDTTEQFEEMVHYLPRCGGEAGAPVQERIAALLAAPLARRPPSSSHGEILARNEGIARRNGMSEEEIEGVRAINEYRIMMGQAPLTLHAGLIRATRRHTLDMVENNFTGHEGTDGSHYMERARREGFNKIASENVSGGRDMTAHLNNWIHSPPHNRNMLRRAQMIGLGMGPNHATLLVGD